jgi:NRAMP (natural resistance-associated macrophage protein)-like metal ion transporter
MNKSDTSIAGDQAKPRMGRVRTFFSELGPGLITGAADDDPSGISTYSVAGASFGYLPLWLAPFAFPLMFSVQWMCARLGIVTGRGLAGTIRIYYPRWVLWGACTLLIIANVFNIGADLGGMSEATEMMTGIPSYFWTPVYTAVIISFLFFSTYRQLARIFKWLTLVLFAYVVTAFLAQPDWYAVLKATFVPRIEFSNAFLATFVGIIGTTISPYLFFWQTAQEVEDERARGKMTVKQREGASTDELRIARTDIFTGMLFANIVMYFILLTTASTLHASGQTHIETAQQAAEALRPLAGHWAYLLFTIGIVGTGMLAVPVLAGSASYAVCEAEHWRGSLEDKPSMAPRFYAVIAVAMILGLAVEFFGFSAVRMLFYSAVLNGILAPPLIVLVVLLNSNRRVMGDCVTSRPIVYLGWAAALIMGAAAIGMFITM